MTDQMHSAPEEHSAQQQPPTWVPQDSQQPWPYQPWPPQQPVVPQPYGYYPYPPASTQQKSRFGVGMLVGLGIGLAVAVVGVVLLGILSLAGAPANPGDSEHADTLYALCDQGDMAACDLLYWESAIGSELEEFGATCGGRVTTWQDGDCIGAGIEGAERTMPQ